MIVVPEKPRWSADEKERKKYKKDLAEFKKYLHDALLVDENTFDEFFSLSTTEHYIMFNFRGWGFDRDKYNRGVIKRFKTGKYGFLTFEEIEDITQELRRMKEESEREEKEEAVREKAESILSEILEKYDIDYSDRGKNGGFGIGFNVGRIDYPNSIFIEYNPVNDLGFDDDDNDVKRLEEAVGMYILIDGTLTTPEFQLPDALTKTLDRIMKTADKCIEWQIEITDFAENLKKEINPKYFELAKEM